MRLRSEATGGHDFGWLIAIGLGLLGLALAGIIMLAVAGWRHLAGRSSPRLLIAGAVLLAPLLLVLALML